MIRINLLPSKKKAARASRAAGGAAPAGAGQWWVMGWLVGWLLLVGAGWWLLTMEEEATAAVRQQAAAKTHAAEVIKQDIDEEGLEASKQQLATQEAIKAKLEAKRRTPVYVMYELAMILTHARDGGGPDIDKEKLRQLTKVDAQAEPNPLWDPTGLWLTKVEEKKGAERKAGERKDEVLAIEGGARDATDLSEFTRRLRASARFDRVSHPDFDRVEGKGKGDEPHLTWELEVTVAQWD